MGPEKKPLSVKKIFVDGLFGYTSYELPAKDEEERKSIDDFFILYGDNGCGKTTILNLLYSIIVPERVSGAKTLIANTSFKEFSVTFFNDTKISATRVGVNNVGSYCLSISKKNGCEFSLDIIVGDSGDIDTDITSYLTAIRELNLSVYFLRDDRRALEVRGQRDAHLGYHLDERGVPQRLKSVIPQERSHHLDIAPILERVMDWVRRQTIRGSSRGEKDIETIYKEIIYGIARPHSNKHEEGASSLDELFERATALREKTEQFSRYGLIREFQSQELIDIAESAAETSRGLIATVLRPYVEGVEARVRALTHVYNIMNRFIETIEPLLLPKKIRFTITHGIKIHDKRGREINPNLLSSGERQIILLFCHAVLVGNKPAIMIIDEPELSLNIKWQRDLLMSFARLTADSPVQFILATHSLEVLAKHRASAVYMNDTFKEVESAAIEECSEEDADNAE